MPHDTTDSAESPPRVRSAAANSPVWYLRLRTELAGAFLVCVALPALYRHGLHPALFGLTERQLSLGILAAVLIGYFLHRKLTDYPGIAPAAYIVPSFAAAFGIVIAVFFFSRIDYSRLAFIMSFAFAVGWAIFYDAIRRARRVTRLGIVPGGKVDGLERIGAVEWHRLLSPSAPTPALKGVVADLTAELPAEWERFIAATALKGTPVYHVKQIQESLTGRVEIEHLSENTLGSLNPDQAYLKIKQWSDWAVAATALVVLSPVLLAIVLAIRLDSPGPALFRQPRVGYRGAMFDVVKFRTMRHPADAGTAHDGPDWLAAVTLAEDPRITRVGRFLRRTRLDELPQIVNILRGEMSWIGPRPEAAVLSRHYETKIPFYSYRHIVRPGITGWAQVNQGHVAAVEEVNSKLHYDFFYVRNFSAWLDALIVMRTIHTIATGFGWK